MCNDSLFPAHSNPVDMPSRGHSEDGDSGIARSGMHAHIYKVRTSLMHSWIDQSIITVSYQLSADIRHIYFYLLLSVDSGYLMVHAHFLYFYIDYILRFKKKYINIINVVNYVIN